MSRSGSSISQSTAAPLRRLALACLAFAGAFSTALGQDSKSSIAVQAAIGLGATHNFAGLHVDAQAYYNMEAFQVGARFWQLNRMPEFETAMAVPSHISTIREIAVLAGVSGEYVGGQYGAVAGPALVLGKYNAWRNNETYSVLGLGVGAWGLVNLFPRVRAGAQLNVNVNSRHLFGGAAVVVQYTISAAS